MMRDSNYYSESLKKIKEKSTKTRWGIKMPSHDAFLNFKDYFEVFIGYNKRVGLYQERSLLPGQKKQMNTYDIETHAFINYTTGQVNAIAFSEKIDPSIKHLFMIRQPGNVKKVSIATYSFNDKSEARLVNNFDPQGNPHMNNFSIYNNYEKPYYKKYFGLTAPAPHFHFNTQRQDVALSRPNAISVKSIIDYLDDLENKPDDPFLQNDSMGMPFLAIKNNDTGYLGVLRDIARKYSNEYYDDDITEFFYQSFEKLNSKLRNYDESVYSFKNLQADMEILQEFKKRFPKYKDIISDFGYHILSSLNQCPVIDNENPNNDRDR